MYAGTLSVTDIYGQFHQVVMRFSDHDPFHHPYSKWADEQDAREHQSRAAHKNIAGVPPIDLPLCTRPLLARAVVIIPELGHKTTARPRWSGKQRRPVRSRHKLRTWER